MVDLHILELQTLVGKADNDIMTVLVLPVCELFSVALTDKGISRSRQAKDARFATTMTDMSCWLQTLYSVS